MIIRKVIQGTVQMQGMTHGLYEIYWRSGGSSLASVGYDSMGNNWFAPTNWTSGVTIDWSGVTAFKLLVPNDYSKKTKDIRSDYTKELMSDF